MKKLFYQKVKKCIQGLSLGYFFIISEHAFICNRINDIPKFAAIRYFFPIINLWLFQPFPAFLLFFFSLPFLYVSLYGVKSISKKALLLIAIGSTYYPLSYFLKQSYYYPLIWSILIFFWLGVNSLVRSINFLFSSALICVLWDLITALAAFRLGMERIGVPYSPSLPIKYVICIDVSLLMLLLFLWQKKGLLLRLEKVPKLGFK